MHLSTIYNRFKCSSSGPSLLRVLSSSFVKRFERSSMSAGVFSSWASHRATVKMQERLHIKACCAEQSWAEGRLDRQRFDHWAHAEQWHDSALISVWLRSCMISLTVCDCIKAESFHMLYICASNLVEKYLCSERNNKYCRVYAACDYYFKQ